MYNWNFLYIGLVELFIEYIIELLIRRIRRRNIILDKMMYVNEIEVLLCVGGCGFFGIWMNNNFCFFCYKKSVFE